MKIYRIETYGMKNIGERLIFDFYPSTIKSDSQKITNIKAIYGTNGVGKSAFINSVDLYRNLLVNDSFLKQNNEIKTLNKIINKCCSEFYFSVIFSERRKPNDVYKHEIKLVIENEIPIIKLEVFSKLKSTTINGEFETLFEVNEGNLIINRSKLSYFDKLMIDVSKNRLKSSTLASIVSDNKIVDEMTNYLDEIENMPYSIKYLFTAYHALINRLLGESIVVYLDAIDQHREYDEVEFTETIRKAFIEDESKSIKRFTTKSDFVVKNKYEEYEKHVNRLYEFLNIFKSDLLGIEIERQEGEDGFYCKKKMKYEKYTVDSDYESTGIQKMMKIFDSIEAVINGKIVFIDELDANINGVYLNALLEYIHKNKKGQMCFTTHNLFPMEYLCKFSNSIDFIGETGKKVTWVKNGNYKPFNQYPEGMIEDSPFNIDYIDFIRVFGLGDNN